jgi:hypothetical protein
MLLAMATSTREIPRAEWRTYFDAFSRNLEPLVATLEVSGEEVGAQIEADTAKLRGITYDDKDDILVIGLDSIGGSSEDVERVVSAPQTIYLETLDGGALNFDVEDGEGVKTLLRLTRPPELGAA